MIDGIPIIEIRLSGLKAQILHAVSACFEGLGLVIEEELDKAIRKFDVRQEVSNAVQYELREHLRKLLKASVEASFREYRGQLDNIVKLRMLEALSAMEHEE